MLSNQSDSSSTYVNSFLNGWPYIFLFLQSEALYKSSIATATALGTDMINISLIFGLLVYKYFKSKQI